jgi:FecR-like protein
VSEQPKLGPPPVEPLSDVAWARVERGLWARLDAAPGPVRDQPPRRRWIWVAAPLVAAMAIVFLVTRDRSDDHTPPETADVRVVAPATASTTATFDDAHIELAPASAIVMRRDRPTTLLERGAAWFSVAPRVDRPEFIVLAGDTTVRVLGTRFRVARTDERVTVEVDHGRVEVQYRDRVQILGAKQIWNSDAPERIEMRVQTADVPKPVDPKPEPKPEPKPRPAGDLDQAKFEQLSVVEKRNPQAAITGYLEIAQRGSKWSANALFAAARLAADRKDPRAEQLLTSYLKRFPSHANADDARALLRRLR